MVVEVGHRREDAGARARGDGMVAEEGRLPEEPRAGGRLHPRPRQKDRHYKFRAGCDERRKESVSEVHIYVEEPDEQIS